MKLSGDDQVRYQAIIDSQIAGPFTLEGLESLAYLGKINPDTLVTVADRFEFRAIRAMEFARTLFPRMEEPGVPETWVPPEADESADRKRYRLTEAKFETVADPTAPRGRIDVYDILDEIRQTEIASGRDHVHGGGRFRISKRSRDFWIMLIIGNAVLIGGGIAMQNTSSIVFGFAGSGLYTFGLLWSMYGVMGRY